MPAISVILPVYNGGDYLKQSVQSVLSQTFEDFECLIIDDCSTDGSYEYISAIADSRVTVLRNDTNRGLFFNLNKMTGLAVSGLIKLWSQDDIMFPGCLAEVVAFHRQHPEIGFSYTQYETIDENGNIVTRELNDETPTVIPSEMHSRIALYSGSIAGNIANVTITRSAVEKAGPFTEEMKISGDFEMWIRIAQFFPVGYVKKKLIYLRAHAGQLSRQEDLFIFHLKEDSEAYRKLFSYIDQKSHSSAKRLMRWSKSQFYYRLMLKCLLSGNFLLFMQYYRYVSKMDNLVPLTGAFLVKSLGLRKLTLHQVINWPGISHVK